MKTILPLTRPMFCISFMQKQFFSKIRFKGKLIALCAFVLISQLVSARTVKPDMAHTVAKHFYQSTTKGASITGAIKLSPVFAAIGASLPSSDELLHVFNVNQSDGFVIIAGDDAIMPVLGYSENGSFDPENLPDNFAKWLEGYQKEVLYAINNNLKASNLIQGQWQALKKGSLPQAEEEESVLPLLTTTWAQKPYYNDYCPGGSVTGCAATAMAQVMNYWAFPFRGSGFHWYLEETYGVLWWNFNSSQYKWWNMPDHLTGPNDDVASLMYQCGLSINMEYSPSSSGANPTLMKGALRDYFGYDPAMKYEYKKNYTSADWNSKMIAELDAGRPVIYAGFADDVGHGFICDGYSPNLPDNNLFHMNWGWGGTYDGYFVLSGLTPDGTGTGGGSSNNGGYNSDQAALIGIQPDPLGPPALEMAGPPAVNDTSLIYGEQYLIFGVIQNSGVTDFNGKIAPALFNHGDDALVTILDSTNVSLNGLTGVWNGISSGQLNVLPGFYYISYLYKAANSNNWVQIDNSLSNNKTNISIIDASSGNDMFFILEQPQESSKLIEQNTAFTVSVKLGNFLANPSWNGSIAAELYSMDFNHLLTIDEIHNVSINFTNLDFPLTFTSFGINVDPGNYRIAIRGKSNNSSAWTLPASPPGVQSSTLINILAPSIQPDAYESNNTITSAYPLGMSFSNNMATVNTQGSNLHEPEDFDHYKIELPTGYDYEFMPRVHDSYNSNNGQSYTNDVRFVYAINNGSFSDSYDDIFYPGSFTVQGGNTVYFKVNPYFQGMLGTYLLDMQITRTPSTNVNDLLEETIFKLYPNPANFYVFVELLNTESEVESMNLYSITGQLVYSQPFIPGQVNRIPTDDLPDGLYLLNVITEEGISSKKVSISH